MNITKFLLISDNSSCSWFQTFAHESNSRYTKNTSRLWIEFIYIQLFIMRSFLF